MGFMWTVELLCCCLHDQLWRHFLWANWMFLFFIFMQGVVLFFCTYILLSKGKGKGILINGGGQTGKDQCRLTWADGVKVADRRDRTRNLSLRKRCTNHCTTGPHTSEPSNKKIASPFSTKERGKCFYWVKNDFPYFRISSINSPLSCWMTPRLNWPPLDTDIEKVTSSLE